MSLETVITLWSGIGIVYGFIISLWHGFRIAVRIRRFGGGQATEGPQHDFRRSQRDIDRFACGDGISIRFRERDDAIAVNVAALNRNSVATAARQGTPEITAELFVVLDVRPAP